MLDRGLSMDAFLLPTPTSVKVLDLFTGGKLIFSHDKYSILYLCASVSMMSAQALKMKMSSNHRQSVCSAASDERLCSLCSVEVSI